MSADAIVTRTGRSAHPVTYQLRVDLDETWPPVWRRLEVDADLYLDELHAVLQAAFAWSDRHLHRFSIAPEQAPDPTDYLGPVDVAEGDQGTLEDEVRLREVLAEVGDSLHYQYDYGDNWWHTIWLEGVSPRDPDEPSAVCISGKRPAPPEDCGGPPGYELLVAASDPAHPEHTDRAAELTDHFGAHIDAAAEITPFDIDAVNAELGDLDLGGPPRSAEVPAPLAELRHELLVPRPRRHFNRLLAAAALDQVVDVGVDIAAAMTRPYRWLLDRVGDDGITLTKAGYLPPAHVEAAFAELGFDEEWVGAGNREDHTVPVWHLRDSATRLGLLRKHRGRLLATARGRAARDDSGVLWRHLAERLPLSRTDDAERDAGLLLLLAVAAGEPGDDRRALIAEVLETKGWRQADGRPLSDMTLSHLLWPNWMVLRQLGVLVRSEGALSSDPATPEGQAFARAALIRWPDRR